MPTPKKGPRLGGSPAPQKAILANLATSLFEHGAVTTTEAKARVLRPYAERLITKAKRGDLHNRRQVMSVIRDKGVVHTLFTEIGPRFAERPGGYTRITKIGPRKGDNAPMAVIALVHEELTARTSRGAGSADSRGTAGAGAAATASTDDTAADSTEDSAADDTTADNTEDSAADDTAESTPAAEAADDTAPGGETAGETTEGAAPAEGADEELAAQTEEQEAVADQEPEGEVPAAPDGGPDTDADTK